MKADHWNWHKCCSMGKRMDLETATFWQTLRTVDSMSTTLGSPHGIQHERQIGLLQVLLLLTVKILLLGTLSL